MPGKLLDLLSINPVIKWHEISSIAQFTPVLVNLVNNEGCRAASSVG